MSANLRPLVITIRGEHDSGKTTVANLIYDFLLDVGYKLVTVVKDAAPLAPGLKDDLAVRIRRNQERRPVHIKVELEE